MRKAGRWAWPVIAAVCGLTLFFAFAIRNIKVEGGTVFLPPTHPVERAIASMERTFGSSEMVSVMMRQTDGSIFTPQTLKLIARITSELAALPGVDEVRSITNSDFMSGGNGQITVDRLMPTEPVTAADAERVRDRALSWEMYKGSLVSNDLKSTQWIVTLKSEDETNGSYTPVVNAIRKVISAEESPARHFMVTGEIAVKALLVTGITRDLTYLLPILVIVLITILYFAFRRPGGVMLPLATVLMSTVWTVGLMALFGVPINIMGTAIPLLLVTVGSAYGIHFLSHYYEEIGGPAVAGGGEDGSGGAGTGATVTLDRGEVGVAGEGIQPAGATVPSPASALRDTVRKVGLPILLAGVTTIAGFGSLGSASVPAILHMGIFTAVGVFCALLLTFTFVPAMLVLTHPRPGSRKRGREQESSPGRIVRILTSVYDLCAHRPILLAALVLLLVGLSAVGISRIQVGQPTVNFFRPSSPIRQAAAFADQEFGGSTVMYVIVRPSAGGSGGTADAAADPAGSAPPPSEPSTPAASGPAGAVDAFESFGDLSKMQTAQPGGTGGEARVTDPDVLTAITGLEHTLVQSGIGVGSARSLTTMISQMNRVMHDGSDAFYEIPTEPSKYDLPDKSALRRLIAQYLLLYSGSLRSFIDSTDSPQALRIVLQMTDGNPGTIAGVKHRVESYAEEHLAPLGFSAETVGLPDEVLAMNDSIMRSQVMSLSLALLFVLVTIWIAYRSVRIGLAGLVPIVLSLLLNFGAMGFLHIPLDIVTAMIASVAIGIGIDYAIHVVSAYVLQYRLTGDTEAAAHRTLGLTGRAIFFNVASVAVGFAVLVFSMFTPLNSLGILVGVIMVTSSFFALTLLPVILRTIVPRLVRVHEPVGVR